MVIASATDLKTDVSAILFNHYGRENAVTGLDIARRLGHNENRAVRRAIRELINEGVPIASVTMPPAGYFIVATKDEADTYLQHLRDLLI